ncbi:adenylyl-sulfate kinase [Microbacterium sp. G2-8]|uniref:adenylyl-sulfate kinase n=1 Tax=Microbacterium sp. G2-8 TaxID=2842454 RepID=UPI0027E3127E|nr:adenylyl-sulfate kinase [Microbacterium sp. G2-8]
MTQHDVTITAAQQRDIELALAGAWEGVATLTLTGVDASAGDELVLRDAEGTDIASLAVSAVEHRGGGPAAVEQIGTGEAPDLPIRIAATGSVTARRELGHRDRTDLRATTTDQRTASALVVTGSVPETLEGSAPVIVLDRGDSRALAQAIHAVEKAARTAIVLPAASTHDATLAAARTLVADDLTVVETPIPRTRGRVLLLTGLSGSGKSTISKLLVQKLAEVDERSVSLLDGDEVRLILSAGLGFSRDDRMLNVQRVGWVGALVAQHGGIAVCAPIAPYEAMRAEMRERVDAVGRFVLVHIATPLEVCEQRDRKGLYAKARAGEIGEFTGISDPYQVPADADLTIDASVVQPDDAVDIILAKLAEIDAE